MAKIEYLNSFFISRLMAVAGEIFEVVKDTVSEYEEEIERSKQENRRLMSILTTITANVSNEKQTPDVQASNAAGLTSGQQSSQRPLASDPSLIQMELATMKQEADTQLNEAPASISPCTKSAHDTQTSHADGVLEQQNPCLGPQDTKPSLIQVKLELATIEDETMPQQQLSIGKHACDPDPAESGAFTALDIDEKNCGDLRANSLIGAPLESRDSEAVYCDNAGLSATVIQNLERNHLNTMNCKQIYDNLPNTPAHSQSHLSKKLYSYDKTFRSALSTKKHVTVCHKERPYCCDLCGKCYSYARVLKVHMKTHTAERPFHCNVCGKTFKLKNHLKDHERTHTGYKQYSCSACGMSFIWRNQVRVHIRNHHRDQPATVINKSARKRGESNVF